MHALWSKVVARGSPTVCKKRKSSNRKVCFWQSSTPDFDSFTPPPIILHIKYLQKHPSEWNFLRTKENASLHSLIDTVASFALPSTMAERKLQRKSQRDPNFNIQKTCLAKLDLNSPSTSALLTQSSTTIAFGIPTLRTLLSMLDTVHMVESEEYMERSRRMSSRNYATRNLLFVHRDIFLYLLCD